MKYLKKFENFKPIKNNLIKTIKIKKNINKSINHLQKRIISLKNRLSDEHKDKRRAYSDMNRDKNEKIQKLKELQIKRIKQNAYLQSQNQNIQENIDNSEDDLTLVDILKSPNFKIEDINEKLIGLEEEIEFDFKYEFGEYSIDKYGFAILTSFDILCDLFDVEHGSIRFIYSLTGSYNDYEYYVDDDELNYLNNYLSKDIIDNIKKLSILFKNEINPDENDTINELFNYLGLNSELDDFKMEISFAYDRAIEKSAIELINSLPFNMNYNYIRNNNHDLELFFYYDDIINYIEKYNLKVKTIKEFLENVVESSDFCYDFVYEYSNIYKYLDFKDLVRRVDDVVEKYLQGPDEIFPHIIKCDNLEALKNNIELAIFDCPYTVSINYQNKKLNLFQIANAYNSKEILEFFKSYDFQQNLIEENNSQSYNMYMLLKNSNIINVDIENDYEYLIGLDTFNL